jgi:hypothetical protein
LPQVENPKNPKIGPPYFIGPVSFIEKKQKEVKPLSI